MVRAHPSFWPLMVLLGLLLFNLLFTPGFANIDVYGGRLYGSLIDVFQNGAPVMLLAIGMTLVIASGGIDLSVGSVMALSGAVAALLMTEYEQPVPIAVAGGLAAALLVGVWNGLLVTRVGLQPIVATLISLVAVRGLAQALTDDQKIRFEIPAFEVIANGAVFGVPMPIVIFAALAMLVGLALRKTVVGMYIEAVGGTHRRLN